MYNINFFDCFCFLVVLYKQGDGVLSTDLEINLCVSYHIKPHGRLTFFEFDKIIAVIGIVIPVIDCLPTYKITKCFFIIVFL